MALTITAEIQHRIDEQELGRHRRLLQRARDMRLVASPDYCTPTSCMMWEPTIQGRCELVSASECSCREFALHGSCPHHALMIELTTCH